MDYPNGCTWRIIPLTVDLVRKWFSGLHLVNVSLHFVDYPISGWWFGTCFFFPIILGMSSSQLTQLTFIFFQRGRYTTNQIYIQNDETVILMKMVMVYLLYPMVISNIYISCINGWTNPTTFFFVGWSPRDISRYSRTMLEESQVMGCNMEWAQWRDDKSH